MCFPPPGQATSSRNGKEWQFHEFRLHHDWIRLKSGTVEPAMQGHAYLNSLSCKQRESESRVLQLFNVQLAVQARQLRLSPAGNHHTGQDNRFTGYSSISSSSLRHTTDAVTFCSSPMSSAA
uniref:Uncharacterized protein n=1 Tax=Photinus pyralis TaxID=7054 RepID=A0A1Y1M9A1_PHOPY